MPPSTSTAQSSATLSPDSVSKYETAEKTIYDLFEPTKRIAELCKIAEERDGPDHPFLKWWKPISNGQKDAALEFERAAIKFVALGAPKGTDSTKSEAWVQQYNIMVDAMSRWASKQKEIIAEDTVKKFVADEEALIASKPTI